MRDAYQVAAVRAAEHALMEIVPEGTLMARAAAGLASICAALLRREPGYVYGARVVVLAGSGDNGGDALYAGARLARRGAAVTAIAAGSRVHPGGTAALREAGGRIFDDSEATAGLIAPLITGADLIVDGLLGIGGHGGLRDPFAALAARAEQARQAGATVVAVDLPSGIDADTGAVDGPAVRADVTVTFGALKPGLLIDPGAGHAGAVELADIGLGPYLKDGPAAGPRSGTTSASCCPARAPRRTSTAAACSACWPAATASPGRCCCPRAERCTAGRAWSGWSPRTSPPCWSGRRGRRPWSPCTRTMATGTCPVRSAGSRRGWPARAWAPARTPRPGLARSCAPTSRSWWTRTG